MHEDLHAMTNVQLTVLRLSLLDNRAALRPKWITIVVPTDIETLNFIVH